MICYQRQTPTPESGYQWLPLWTTTLDHGNHVHGWVSVRKTKAPRLRVSPGSIVAYKGALYEVMYCYRTETDPSEWRYYLEERDSVQAHSGSQIQRLIEGVGAGQNVCRVVTGLFRNSSEAFSYFSDIYRAADAVIVYNKDFVQHGRVISSGVLT